MTGYELKQLARQRLGMNIFGNIWITAMLIIILYGAMQGAATAIIPGLGAVVVLGPLGYGLCAIFLRHVRTGETMRVEELFSGFTTDFGGTFLIGLMSQLFSALWGLLFVIPGICKAYSYSMAYFVKMDHPDYGWRECLDESTRLMTGHRWELFGLDLSFIGWFIVGALCAGVGTFWVTAYFMETRALYYHNLVQNDRGYYFPV